MYEECPLVVPPRRNLLDLSVTEIGRLAMQVVEAEGPVHTEEVARRIREAFGLQKTGGLILAHVRRGLALLARNNNLLKDGEFWSVHGRDIQSPRNRRNASLFLRRPSIMAPAEYHLAIKKTIVGAVAISREELIVETARVFGFDRTGPDLKEEIGLQIAALLRDRQIVTDGSVLRTASPAAA